MFVEHGFTQCCVYLCYVCDNLCFFIIAAVAMVSNLKG